MSSTSIDFVKIGPRASLFTPPTPISGEIIILCTWLGAARKHILKYTALHQRVAPGARILLIESDVSILTSSYAKQRKEIQAAVSAILDVLEEHEVPPRSTDEQTSRSDNQDLGASPGCTRPGSTLKPHPCILLHVFSNGGTNTATQLLLVLRDRLKAPLPLCGLLCDSCPAKGTYWRSYHAMVLSLPKNPATQLLGALACHCILVLLYSWIAYGNENPAALNRRVMLDSDIVAPSTEGERRVSYFFSKEDPMCLWSDVASHAEEAKHLGWSVQEVRFEGSGHCAHLSLDEKKYVDAVKSVWNSGQREVARRETSKL